MTESITVFVESLALAAIVAWMLFSAFAQCPLRQTFLRLPAYVGVEALGLVPEWNFFAPNPGRFDFHILFRDKTSDGSISSWQELYGPTDRPFLYFFWNFRRRQNKVLFDICSELLKTQNSLSFHQQQLSVAYITISTAVASAKHDALSISTQFLILAVRQRNPSTAQPIYISPFQKLE